MKMKNILLFGLTFIIQLYLVSTVPLDVQKPTENEQEKIKSEKLNVGPILKSDNGNEQNVIRKIRTYKMPSDDSSNEESMRKAEMNARHTKMLDYFNYYPAMFAATFPVPAFYPTPTPQLPPQLPPISPTDYYDAYNGIDEDDEDMSRANRRRPSGNQNSPIFYIRLPPTPYMYVPGMGYISQPPTIQPISTQYPVSPPVRHVPMNPFINVPVNFLSNGKPTNIYQWNTAPPMSESFGPQYPSYLPSRPPHRPQYRPPKPSYLQDSKITHLKGPFVFNGRPEEIFVLPSNPYSSTQFSTNYNVPPPPPPPYSNTITSFGSPLPYSNPLYSQPGYGTPYNAPFNSIYTDSVPNYY